MNIGIVLIHNKKDVDNFTQIENLKSLLFKVEETGTNDDGKSFTFYHYELVGLLIPHKVVIHQILPSDKIQPPNFNDINSTTTIYTPTSELNGDKDVHAFNNGFTRITDMGAEVAIIVDDSLKLTAQKLVTPLSLYTKTPKYTPNDFGPILTVEALKQMGGLSEQADLATATDLYISEIGGGN